MSDYLGIDTSNYTTSAAIFDSDNSIFFQEKMPLPVKSGEKGLRQSDAVFHHTVQLPQVITKLFSEHGHGASAVGVSVSPRSESGSYMPCFLAGVSAAKAVSAVSSIPLFEFSHQAGHIAAVLAQSKNTELFNKSFIAFHLSGGTTEAVLVKPDKNIIISTEIVSKSLDLKAGQAIDRTGVMLSIDFPCGVELDRLSLMSDKKFNISPSMKGNDCSLSGVENKCRSMLENGEAKEDIALFCISSVIAAADGMYKAISKKFSELPLVFSGGVSSNTLLRNYFSEKYGAIFATPQFSADNAAGIAYLAYLKSLG